MSQEASNKLPPEIAQALADKLRDVHLPDAISWWPLAWGWWVLLIITLCAVCAIIWLIKRTIDKNRYRSLALTELNSALSQWRETKNNSDYLQTANAILKRSILHTSGLTSLTTTSGQKWVELLNSWGVKPLSTQSQNALAYECYQANSQTDIEAVHLELAHWLKKHRAQTPDLDVNIKSAQIKRGQHA